ncbi:N-formylglutamate amidohydrolase, partial [Candidatus Peregrinibacteria bacterium]|nr:N-formylglutamate amidohydrolase [Candidatus Peregrinibacteria bacterium]
AAFLATHSRCIVDLNRSPAHLDLFRDTEFADPPNRIWHPWQEPTVREQDDILRCIYRPYHDRILSCLQELAQEDRPILVVAWDNMGRYPLRSDGSPRPGHTVPIILSNRGKKGGTDPDEEPTSCDPSLLSSLAEEFRTALLACGFPSNVTDGIHFNRPDFKGGYICEHYTTRRHPELPVHADIQSLQVEYDVALTHNPRTLEADGDAIRRLQQAFSSAMERVYANLLP